ncbi:hypothetical protein [Pasteurella phage PHB01]|uniref:Uncharacterized protein n=1 Tax=Pasteurella phage PHB01 TaxID=2006930 RepID=A0A218M4E3_9CAUD|nr:hypothetical protein HOR83_gp02 [Pasteurella phage PHB01]ASD51016.1 hypothetical protein [Pasteurella phage PHB01]
MTKYGKVWGLDSEEINRILEVFTPETIKSIESEMIYNHFDNVKTVGLPTSMLDIGCDLEELRLSKPEDKDFYILKVKPHCLLAGYIELLTTKEITNGNS